MHLGLNHEILTVVSIILALSSEKGWFIERRKRRARGDNMKRLETLGTINVENLTRSLYKFRGMRRSRFCICYGVRRDRYQN